MQAHWLDNDKELSEAVLREQGVLYERLPTEKPEYQPSLDALREKNGYLEQDVVSLEPDTPNLAAICNKFVDEHFHDEDEVRFVLEGEGIFDIRSLGDRWMRVMVDRGDLIVVPARRHHRFMLTDKKSIRCVRLFKDRSGWVPHYRLSG